jgi:hypothetical protein
MSLKSAMQPKQPERSSARLPLFGALVALGSLGALSPAHAQINLPPVQLPGVRLPLEVDRTLNGALDRTRIDALQEVRRLRIGNLLRTNRAVLEADPRGAPIIRNEVVAFSPTPAALEQARAAGFEVARTRTLEGLDASIVVLRAPPRVSTRQALRQLRRADPDGVYDFNHLYQESGEIGAQPVNPTTGPIPGSITSPATSPPAGRVGLIDGGIDRSHEVFRDSIIHEHGCTSATPSAHGTAVASLIAGHSGNFNGAAPGAELFIADVYCGVATGGAVDAVAEAFAWLSRERVPVINVSLVGPANAMLEQVVRIVVARGYIVVAAVGNDGPSSPPLFPAAYPGVIAVTGVDAHRRVLLEACRGRHVRFAAPGADMSAAATEHPFALVRGTSFAAPIVSGLLAAQLHQPDRANADAAIVALTAQAIDLGARGPDKIYGSGLVGETTVMREVGKSVMR